MGAAPASDGGETRSGKSKSDFKTTKSLTPRRAPAIGPAFSAVWFDYNRDGHLDLLMAPHAPYEDVVRCLLDPGFRCAGPTPRLFRNRGDSGFEEVTAAAGLDRCYGVMQAVAGDLNADGWPDLVLVSGSLDAQRLEPSVVLRNRQGRFEEWCYLPGFDAPRNFTGLQPGGAWIENPLLRLAHPGQ